MIGFEDALHLHFCLGFMLIKSGSYVIDVRCRRAPVAESLNSGTQITTFTGSTSGPELLSTGGKDSPKINQNRPVPKPRSSWLLQKPLGKSGGATKDLPKDVEIMKTVPKPRLSFLEKSENIVEKSEGVCFMFTGNGEDKQKETESNKNKTTADASEEVVTEETEENENPTSNVEIQETETGGLGPKTLKLFDIIADESDARIADVVTENSDVSIIQESESESELQKPPDIVKNAYVCLHNFM